MCVDSGSGSVNKSNTDNSYTSQGMEDQRSKRSF
jgi:hypothetical protein